MSKAPSTGSFSHGGGRKLFLEEARRKQGIVSCHQLPEERSSEKAGLEIVKPVHRESFCVAPFFKLALQRLLS